MSKAKELIKQKYVDFINREYDHEETVDSIDWNDTGIMYTWVYVNEEEAPFQVTLNLKAKMITVECEYTQEIVYRKKWWLYSNMLKDIESEMWFDGDECYYNVVDIFRKRYPDCDVH